MFPIFDNEMNSDSEMLFNDDEIKFIKAAKEGNLKLIENFIID
jgi:hypothetical protein